MTTEKTPNQEHNELPDESLEKSGGEQASSRRGFLRNIIMLGSLSLAYGSAAFYALRYLYPGRKKTDRIKMYVASSLELIPGQSKSFATPAGENYLLTNTGDGIQPFIAFSSRCPHLGCKVHWEGKNKRFFCPCHGGAFNANGEATQGPPKDGGQNLKSCEIRVEGTAIYAMVEKS